MKVILNIENDEQLTALECALYIATKQWEEEWKYKPTTINRKILVANKRVYNQLYKYCNLIKPKIKGIKKRYKIMKGGE